jgi:hypothetical protein
MLETSLSLSYCVTGEHMARPKKSKGISKMEAVRQAITKMGKDIKPPAILSFVKENYSLDMSYDMASNYKGLILKKRGGRRRGRKPGRKPVALATNGSKAGGITLADIEAVKALADRLGAEKVRQLAAVLAK